MSINVLEKKSSISIESTPDKEYKIGESLVELAKTNFSDLHKFLHTEIPSDTTYEKYFSDLFKFNYNSIYYKLLENTLIDFYNNYDDSDCTSNKTFPFSIIREPYEFKQEMSLIFLPLFEIQKKVEKILLCLASSNEDNKTKNLSLLYKSKPDLFNFARHNTDSIYNKYDALFNENIISIDNDIIFREHFSDIESLCIFELKRLLKSTTKIIVCPVCNEIYVAKDKRQIYCSNTCKYKENKKNKNNNIFYILYRKKYRSLFVTYSAKKANDSNENLPKEIKIALKNLKNEYIDKDENNQSIIEEYEKKLGAIK